MSDIRKVTTEQQTQEVRNATADCTSLTWVMREVTPLNMILRFRHRSGCIHGVIQAVFPPST